jgi:chromosome segregation ATPase
LFSLSKCTNSCTRGREIDRLNYQIVQQDSALKANDIIIDKLSTRLDDANTSIDNYKGIATGNQKDLIDKLNTLTNDNKELNTKINKITKENNNLTKENTQLKKEIKTLEEKVSNLESYLSIE